MQIILIPKVKKVNGKFKCTVLTVCFLDKKVYIKSASEELLCKLPDHTEK